MLASTDDESEGSWMRMMIFLDAEKTLGCLMRFKLRLDVQKKRGVALSPHHHATSMILR